MSDGDLQKMGLELIPGAIDQYRKKKTVLQPREKDKSTSKNKSLIERIIPITIGYDAACYKVQQEISKYRPIRVELKPLSVNEAWRGRRFKTDKYLAYQQATISMLPNIALPSPPYKLTLTFAVSSRNADIDNPAKLFIDILQKKYQFNDKEIYELNIKKILVAKRKEYVEFKIEHLND